MIRNMIQKHGTEELRHVSAVCRFTIRATLGHEATKIQYSIKVPGVNIVPSGAIPVAAAGAEWHVAAYSCNDQRQLPKVWHTAAFARPHVGDASRPMAD
jgi:hypothetical protein